MPNQLAHWTAELARRDTLLPALMIALVGTTGLAPSSALAQDARASAPVSPATFDQWIKDLSNWQRWGPTDELGTLNLITTAKRRAAAALVKDGATVSLARDIAKEVTATNPAAMRYRLLVQQENDVVSWAADSLAILFHGYTFSHLDALPHTLYRGQLYNGYPKETLGPDGAAKLGVSVIGTGIVTRGVLVDIPRSRGVPFLEPGTAITTPELEQWERHSGIRIEAGDVLLVRTGRWAGVLARGPWDYEKSLAGLHPSVARFLKERGVAALGSDGVSDVFPSPVPGFSNPLHQLALVALGMPLLDNLDLEAVAAAAAARQRWTFLFVAAPLRIPGGTGSPLNPIAVF